jgi:TolB-like protein
LAGLLFLVFTAGAYAQNGERLGKIAIPAFSGGSVDEREGIAELFSFTQEMMDNFSVIPRTNIIKAVELELGFQAMSGMTDAATIAKFGESIGADYVMAGSITSLGSKHLLIVSVIKIEEIRQVAGDYLVYDSLDALNHDEKILNDMADNLVQMMRGIRYDLDELALLPVQLDGANKEEGDALAQLLAIYLLRVGKYAVYPRTNTLEQVQSEYENQLLGGITRASEAVKTGKAVNPKYVLSVVSRKIATGMRFNASIIDLEGRNQIAGKSEPYVNLSDGMNAMEFLARELSGEEVSARDRSGRTNTIAQEQEESKRAAEARARAEEDREAARARATARAEAMDKFLENSGIVLGGWFGTGLGGSKKTLTTDKETGEEKTTSETTTNGGGSIELRLNPYFGIQTGLNVLSDYAPYTPRGNEEQYADLVIMQIPVLARVSFSLTTVRVRITEIKIAVFGFAGAGLNVTAITSDAESVDPARMSIIAGAGVGFTGENFALNIGYQWNGDLSDSSLTVGSASYDYTRRMHIINFGLSYYLPFRRDK